MFKYILLACLLTGVLAVYSEEHYDNHPKYKFHYNVYDTLTHDIKEQEEARDGDNVKGEYSLVEPDGGKRTVKYSADEQSGFHATVIRENHVYKDVHIQEGQGTAMSDASGNIGGFVQPIHQSHDQIIQVQTQHKKPQLVTTYGLGHYSSESSFGSSLGSGSSYSSGSSHSSSLGSGSSYSSGSSLSSSLGSGNSYNSGSSPGSSLGSGNSYSSGSSPGSSLGSGSNYNNGFSLGSSLGSDNSYTSGSVLGSSIDGSSSFSSYSTESSINNGNNALFLGSSLGSGNSYKSCSSESALSSSQESGSSYSTESSIVGSYSSESPLSSSLGSSFSGGSYLSPSFGSESNYGNEGASNYQESLGDAQINIYKGQQQDSSHESQSSIMLDLGNQELVSLKINHHAGVSHVSHTLSHGIGSSGLIMGGEQSSSLSYSNGESPSLSFGSGVSSGVPYGGQELSRLSLASGISSTESSLSLDQSPEIFQSTGTSSSYSQDHSKIKFEHQTSDFKHEKGPRGFVEIKIDQEEPKKHYSEHQEINIQPVYYKKSEYQYVKNHHTDSQQVVKSHDFKETSNSSDVISSEGDNKSSNTGMNFIEDYSSGENNKGASSFGGYKYERPAVKFELPSNW